LLAGHLGTGKTEIARHMAKLHMMENGIGYEQIAEMKRSEHQKRTEAEKLPAGSNERQKLLKEARELRLKANNETWYDRLEPEFFSGSDEATIYDLVGKNKPEAKGGVKPEPKEIKKRISELSDALLKAGIESVPEKQLTEIVLGKQDVTTTAFQYGPFGRAMKEGRPIIVDEINMIPPEVLGRLNQDILRGVGSKTILQENSEEPIEIKPGFAIIATCNLGEQYAGIKNVNAAFKSRWIGREVSYPEMEESFDLAITSLLRGDFVALPPEFPAETFEKITDLTVAVREIQDLFAGETEETLFMSEATETVGEKAELEETVVSTRDLMRKIMEPWKNNGFEQTLDEIIAKNILAGEVFNKSDQRVMTEIFIRRGFFKGWDAERLHNMGIESVTQKQLDALHGALTDESRNVDDPYKDIHDQALGSLQKQVKQHLMRGTGASMKQ